MTVLTTVLGVLLFSVAQPPADQVLLNGQLITLDPQKPEVQALAVQNQRICALGSDEEIKKWIGPKTQVLDLKGATGVPGFIDGHAHLTGIGRSKMILDLMHVKNWDEVIAKVAEACKKVPPGTLISGRGWHQEKWDKVPVDAVEGYPVHAALSAASPDHPVVLTHASGHALFANAKAMALSEVSKATPNPEGGKILRTATGEPTGIFEENGMLLIKGAMGDGPNIPRSQRKALVVQQVALAMKECLSKGLTGLHDAGVDFETIDIYRELADEGKLDLRLWVMAEGPAATLAEKLPQYKLKDYGNGFLTVGGIKCYMDGALGSRGAWLLAPYADLAGHTGQNVTSLADLAATAAVAKTNGVQLCIHAIGDRGNREVLNLYEQALAGEDRRWRIEHAQHIDPADVPRFAKLKVVASMQGVHCTSDAPFVEKRLGAERAEAGAYVWRKLLDAGAVVTNGTDAPIEDVSPLASFYSMVTRQNDSGSFYPGQRLTAMEALKAYTLSNAYAGFAEKTQGSLEVGKFADVTVVSEAITKVAPEKIKSARVLYTIVGGVVKYKAE